MTGQPLVKKGMNPKNTTPAQDKAIRFLQNFWGLKVDGDFGAKSDTAARAHQKAHGLKVDGVVGDKTWATIPATGAPATQQQNAARAATAAVTAASAIKQTAAAAKTPKPAATPAAQVVKRPVTVQNVIRNPVQAAAQAATSASNAAQRVVTSGATTVKQAHVIIKKQPLWLQIVTFAAAGLGCFAGYKAITDKPKRAA